MHASTHTQAGTQTNTYGKNGNTHMLSYTAAFFISFVICNGRLKNNETPPLLQESH